MKFLKKLIIAILIIVVLILVVAIFLPSKIHIEESITINAPAKAIYTQVVDFRNWEKWSPFQENDTAMVNTYENPGKGVGSKMSWVSKKEGNGTMTIMEIDPNKHIKFKLEFEDAGVHTSEFVFAEENNTTKVTWILDMQDMGYPVGRLMGVFMKGMIHKSFKRGLSNLQKVSEEYQKALSFYKTDPVTVKEMDARMALLVKDSATCDMVSDVLGKIFGQVGEYTGKNGIECDGAPIARWYMWNDTINKFIVEAGFFIKAKAEGKGNIKFVEFPKQKVVTAIHYGPYETSSKSYEAIEKYLKDNKLTMNGVPWEVYIVDPGTQPDMTKWETEIFYPVK